MKRDKSPSTIVCVCVCGARDVALSQRAADAWLVDHLGRCQVMQGPERHSVTAALNDRQRRRQGP